MPGNLVAVGGRVSVENTVQHPRPSLIPGPNGRLSFDACAGTNVGLVRTVNEDAVLDFSEIRLWAGVDGVGGADDHASRLIVDTLGATPAPVSGANDERTPDTHASPRNATPAALLAAGEPGIRRDLSIFECSPLVASTRAHQKAGSPARHRTLALHRENE
jgi:hypothetical protein